MNVKGSLHVEALQQGFQAVHCRCYFITAITVKVWGEEAAQWRWWRGRGATNEEGKTGSHEEEVQNIKLLFLEKL